MAKKMRLYVMLGMTTIDEEFDLPEEWDQMTEKEQNDFSEEAWQTHIANHVDGYWEVVDDDA